MGELVGLFTEGDLGAKYLTGQYANVECFSLEEAAEKEVDFDVLLICEANDQVLLKKSREIFSDKLIISLFSDYSGEFLPSSKKAFAKADNVKMILNEERKILKYNEYSLVLSFSEEGIVLKREKSMF